MQKLKKIIEEARRQGKLTEQSALNLVREYLQVLILKAIYQTKFGKGLSFHGGTCLRICYDLKRFSEDLDFSLDGKVLDYSFARLNEQVASFLRDAGFDVSVQVSEEKVVQKSFVRVGQVLYAFGASPLKSQKLHVKLEVDTRPIPIIPSEVESFFVTKFNEIFPILKHTDPTLFSGKISAVLTRKYEKGRDFYDLVWYLNRKQEINLRYLNKNFEQTGSTLRFKDRTEVVDALRKRVKEVNVTGVLKDLGRFLEDPAEEQWIRNYTILFEQLAQQFLASP